MQCVADVYFHKMTGRRKMNLALDEFEEIVNYWSNVSEDSTDYSNYHPNLVSEVSEPDYCSTWG